MSVAPDISVPSDTPKDVTPSSIHPSSPPRTLVLCFDGIGKHLHQNHHNVVQFCTLLDPHAHEQLIYYQDVIDILALDVPAVRAFSSVMNKTIACTLDTQIYAAYKYIVQNYGSGAKICLFGFSRGAYVARAVAGMLDMVGLPPPHQRDVAGIEDAYRAYKAGCAESAKFKASSLNVDIEIVGVWDTVCSLGLIPHHRPFATSSTSIRVFRQALSLDEHRAGFKANHYNRPSNSEHQQEPRSGSQSQKPKTDVREVWFAGCQYDVGKPDRNDDKHSLARITLRWMVRECFRTKTGIRFNIDRLKEIGLDPDKLYLDTKGIANPELTHPPQTPPPNLNPSPHISTSTSCSQDQGDTTHSGAPKCQPDTEVHVDEEGEEAEDALCPIHDPLVLMRWWWIFEFLPIVHRKQLPNNKWKKYISINLGRGRTIPAGDTGEFFVHKSVKTRMERLGYKPKARNWAKLKPVFVD